MFKCLFYVVNIIIKNVLGSDTHIITIMQDGGQDGCHNHTIRGILLLKRHSYVSYNQCRVFEMPISCCSHNSDVLWFQLGPHII